MLNLQRRKSTLEARSSGALVLAFSTCALDQSGPLSPAPPAQSNFFPLSCPLACPCTAEPKVMSLGNSPSYVLLLFNLPHTDGLGWKHGPANLTLIAPFLI
jgi:hypothetical protein